MNTARHNGERLARTEVNHAANQATYAAYKELGVERYEFLATLDSRTSDICAVLDGRVFRRTDAQTGTNYPPLHPNCRSTTVPYFEPDEFDEPDQRAARAADGKYYTVSASLSYREWKATFVDGNPKEILSFKMQANLSSDRTQYNRYQSILGKNTPKTFADFQDLKYNNSEDWEPLKEFYRYKNKYPSASKTDYTLNSTLKSSHLIRGTVIPKQWSRAYILEDKQSRRDPSHIMKRMIKRSITSEQVQKYIDNALFMESQFKDTRRVYYSTEGVIVITRTSDYGNIDWIAKTVWSKCDFDENTESIMKVVEKHVGKTDSK